VDLIVSRPRSVTGFRSGLGTRYRPAAAVALLGALLTAAIAGEPAPSPVPTTVIVVRHAEKLLEPGEADPPLSPAGKRRAEALRHVLSSLEIGAVYTSPFARTRDTVAPAAADRGLRARETDPRDAEGLAARIRTEHRGQTVLVAGHSNTVPALLQALGVREEIVLDDRHDYDDLFVVTLEGKGARLLHLHYGEPSSPE
jgi:broad specificity phosphatase PhoE